MTSAKCAGATGGSGVPAQSLVDCGLTWGQEHLVTTLKVQSGNPCSAAGESIRRGLRHIPSKVDCCAKPAWSEGGGRGATASVVQGFLPLILVLASSLVSDPSVPLWSHEFSVLHSLPDNGNNDP